MKKSFAPNPHVENDHEFLLEFMFVDRYLRATRDLVDLTHDGESVRASMKQVANYIHSFLERMKRIY